MSERLPTPSHKATDRGRARLRVWAVVNVVVLIGFTGWVFRNADETQAKTRAAHSTAVTVNSTATVLANGSGTAHATAKPSASASPTAVIPTKAQILTATSTSSAKYFGVSATNVPFAPSALRAIAAKAGESPDMVEYYVNWTQNFEPSAVSSAYAQGAIPVLTWESFGGLKGSTWNTLNQPAYALSTIINGSHDAYITAFAKAVAASRLPVVIRFDHEMNGNWFPWNEDRNGNSTGQYVEAWRHVWTIFHQAGATNVIWDWAPNVIRGATISDLAELYPGDQYVDWIGLSAYEDTETTPQQLVDPSLTEIRRFTKLPMLITETGAQPGSRKAQYTANFLSWLPGQSDVIGFIWNEIPASAGSGTDWGFDADSTTLSAFQKGIKGLTLVKVPAA